MKKKGIKSCTDFFGRYNKTLVTIAAILNIITAVCVIAYLLRDIAWIFLTAIFIAAIFWHEQISEYIKLHNVSIKDKYLEQQALNEALPYMVRDEFWQTLSSPLCSRIGIAYPLTSHEIIYEGKDWKKPLHFKYSIAKTKAIPKKNYIKIAHYLNTMYLNVVAHPNDIAGIYIVSILDDPHELDNLLFIIKVVQDAEEWCKVVQQFSQWKMRNTPKKVPASDDVDFGTAQIKAGGFRDMDDATIDRPPDNLSTKEES